MLRSRVFVGRFIQPDEVGTLHSYIVRPFGRKAIEADRGERERQREQRMDWLQQDLDDGLITMDEFNQAYESEED